MKSTLRPARAFLPLLALALALPAGLRAQEPAPPAAVEPISAEVAGALLPNGRSPMPGVVTGGQPDPARLRALAEAGFHTVVDLRTPGEEYARSEEETTAEALGLRYVSIPVAGADGLTEENARALSRVLSDEGAYPVAIHCASGNRVGALLAVEAAWIGGTPPAEALELGRAGGLTRLEPKVRELLGLAEPER